MKSLLILLFLIPSLCFAHSKVISTVPLNGATLSSLPALALINFNKKIETNFHQADLWINNGWVKLPTNVKDKTLNIQIKNKTEKHYKIRWSVISQDGHRQRGTLEFSVEFSVKPDAVNS